MYIGIALDAIATSLFLELRTASPAFFGSPRFLLSYMSQTTGIQSLAPSATFDANLFQTSVLEIRQNFAILGLLGALYGTEQHLSLDFYPAH